MSDNIETIHALRDAAREIHRLRKQVVEAKAEAWDVHSEVIKRIFSGPQGAGICPASYAEVIADRLAKENVSTDDNAAEA